MKRVLILLTFVFGCGLSVLAQSDGIDTNRTHFTFSTGLGGGTGFWGESFTSTFLSANVSHQINNDLRVRAGALTGSFNSSLIGNYQSKAPYRNPHNRQAAEVGVDYKINPRLQLSVTAYFDQINLGSLNNNFLSSSLTTTAFNANLTYKFKNDSFLNLSVTFMETNNPYNTFNPYYFESMHSFSPIHPFGAFGESSFFNW
ncbi:MAG: hypothetical protein LBO06_03660 [Bacteroidales bacterium]|jgi:hypothetical protein|nr:hypothetical protein [Bacteroidales bacterium]